ncbi:adenosylcobinamide-phosphate synthase CbiB [Bacillus seohaeanensis]|uniref:Cobalamin biosynthesis protein CobD n=1 Tax=Bacillus seohaeanensis TaxID=284580 RepID=A0ABW5RTW1_9BACI
MISHLLSIILALFIDRIAGDPNHWPHPVRWIGRLISFLEVRWNRGKYRKWKGTLLSFTVLLTVFFLSLFITVASYSIHTVVGIIIESILIYTSISQRSLKEAALEVYEPLIANNMKLARKKLSYIVGRDTDNLEESEIVRGAVETVAENTSDGITAPLFWAFLGGAPLAMVYRAVNTCDSMVAYKNDRFLEFGWASAWIDDGFNWIPSRLTGIMMVVCSPPKFRTRKESFAILFRDAKKHPSPNSGWGEAAVAAVLGVQLGGLNYYGGEVSLRAVMGDSETSLRSHHITDSIRIMNRTVHVFTLLLIGGGILYELAKAWF